MKFNRKQKITLWIGLSIICLRRFFVSEFYYGLSGSEISMVRMVNAVAFLIDFVVISSIVAVLIFLFKK